MASSTIVPNGSSRPIMPTASINGLPSPSTISSSTIPDTMPTGDRFRFFPDDYMRNFNARPLINEGDQRNRVAMSARAPKQLSPGLDLFEFRKRPFEVPIEEPHRIKNFAEGCRCSCPVSLPKGEDAVVSQISHDRRVGNPVVEQVA